MAGPGPRRTRRRRGCSIDVMMWNEQGLGDRDRFLKKKNSDREDEMVGGCANSRAFEVSKVVAVSRANEQMSHPSCWVPT